MEEIKANGTLSHSVRNLVAHIEVAKLSNEWRRRIEEDGGVLEGGKVAIVICPKPPLPPPPPPPPPTIIIMVMAVLRWKGGLTIEFVEQEPGDMQKVLSRNDCQLRPKGGRLTITLPIPSA